MTERQRDDQGGEATPIEAERTCMTLRGVQATGCTTITSTLLGLLRRDPRSRGEFLARPATSSNGEVEWRLRRGVAPRYRSSTHWSPRVPGGRARRS
ncbi:GTP cyclohydrolase I [Streptacidiphilus sp. MAP12-20]|uniref:GTP cyclohydrolase I n=1 Tax=Streptacidiphilus sp. MAP12-20 TaxID=3156299 RepID=UPI0035196DCA